MGDKSKSKINLATDPESDPAPGGRYHHGALREALLQAGEAELRIGGIERFSLRSVAKRAGVSHAAPAHHFKDADGLLTALAVVGFQRFIDFQRQSRANADTDGKSQLAAGGLAYVAFAEEHPALFRLMFSSNHPNFSDPVLLTAANAAFRDLSDLVEHSSDRGRDRDSAAVTRDVLTVWGLSHGLADLVSTGQVMPLKSMPKEERTKILAEIFARVLRP